MLKPVVAGRIMIGIAIVGAVASLVAGVVGRQLVSDFEDGLKQSLALSAAALDTVDDSFAIADDALEIVTAGVADAEGAVGGLGRSMAEGQTALEALRALTGENVADSLDALEATLPAVEQAATSIDRTLSALSALPFGPSYAPQRPLGATIGELRESIAGLPDELRDQAEQAERMSDELASATEGTMATADALGAIAERLAVASELITQYSQRTAQARDVVEDQRHALAVSARQARILIVGFSALFAVSQVVPLYFGLALSRGHLTVGKA
ncbi:MAG: hypothetical protein WD011_02075 [Nitriliruptoraceae bacterium]